MDWCQAPVTPLRRNRPMIHSRENEASWRNWQTQRIQNPPPARAYRFDSDRGHLFSRTVSHVVASPGKTGRFSLVWLATCESLRVIPIAVLRPSAVVGRVRVAVGPD